MRRADILFEEKASIDEAFIDFTIPVRDELLKRYPYLAEIPPDAPLGKDTPLPTPPPISWVGLGTLIPVNPPPHPPTPAPALPESREGGDDAPLQEENKGDEVLEDTGDGAEPLAQSEEPPQTSVDDARNSGDDSLTTWHDVALSIAAELMDKIRRQVYTEHGYTMTAVRLTRSFNEFDLNE